MTKAQNSNAPNTSTDTTTVSAEVVKIKELEALVANMKKELESKDSEIKSSAKLILNLRSDIYNKNKEISVLALDNKSLKAYQNNNIIGMKNLLSFIKEKEDRGIKLFESENQPDIFNKQMIY